MPYREEGDAVWPQRKEAVGGDFRGGWRLWCGGRELGYGRTGRLFVGWDFGWDFIYLHLLISVAGPLKGWIELGMGKSLDGIHLFYILLKADPLQLLDLSLASINFLAFLRFVGFLTPLSLIRYRHVRKGKGDSAKA